MVKISDFCTYLENEVKNNSLYLWGGQGENVLNMKPAIIINKETTTYNAGRVLRKLSDKLKSGVDMSKARYFDCSGLGVYWFLEQNLIKSDTTANGLYKMCDNIDMSEVKAGDFVFKLNTRGIATHIGYVVKGDCIVESFGRDTGVIKSKRENTSFAVAGRPRFKWE